MKALDKKLWRELWRMKGQVFAISLVVMSGVATFILFISTMHSLDFTRNKFYRDHNFADVFVNLKRAPESLKDKIKNIHGVKQLETRVSAQAKLDIKGFSENVTGKIVSIPDGVLMIAPSFFSSLIKRIEHSLHLFNNLNDFLKYYPKL